MVSRGSSRIGDDSNSEDVKIRLAWHASDLCQAADPSDHDKLPTEADDLSFELEQRQAEQ